MLSLKKLVKVAITVTLTIYVGCMGVVTSVHGLYLLHKAFLAETEDEELRQELENRMKYTYEILVALGGNYRGLGIAGMFSHGMCCIISTARYGSRFIFWRRLIEITGDGFRMFLLKPEVSHSQVARRLACCISRVKESNLSYSRLLALELPRKRHAGSPMRSDDQASDGRRGVIVVGDVHEAISQQKLQLEHLDRLTLDVAPIWPENRCENWRVVIHKAYLLVYCGMFTFSWTVTMICQLVSINDSLYFIVKDESLEPEQKHFNHIERLMFFGHFIFAYISIHWCVEVATDMIVCFSDQRKQLVGITERFKSFTQVLVYVSSRISERSCGSSLDPPRIEGLAEKTLANTTKIKDSKIILNLDSEAIEIYLMLRAYMIDTQLAFGFAEYVLVFLGCMISLISMVLIASSLFVDTPILFRLAVVILICLTNLFFYPACVANADSIKMLQLAWSLLARAEECQMSLSEGAKTEQLVATNQRPGPKLSSQINLVSSHTMLLWRQLVHDSQFASDVFSCDALGLMQLSYSKLLGANFWFLSMVMLFLGHDISRLK